MGPATNALVWLWCGAFVTVLFGMTAMAFAGFAVGGGVAAAVGTMWGLWMWREIVAGKRRAEEEAAGKGRSLRRRPASAGGGVGRRRVEDPDARRWRERRQAAGRRGRLPRPGEGQGRDA